MKHLQGEIMHSRKHTKMIHEGKYIAEVELINTTDDALKVDAIREALRNGNITKAKESANGLCILSEVVA
jgi:FAD synthase